MAKILQRILNTINTFILIIVIINPTHINGQGSQEKIHESDLTYLYNRLITKHPKLQIAQNKTKFDSLYMNTKEGFNDLSRIQALMKMMKLVASLKDGHTSFARLWDEKTKFRRLPLSLYVFADGIYISRIEEKNMKYVGMKVVKIGPKSIDKVIELSKQYLHGDNEMNLKEMLPNRLVTFEFLEGLGLTEKNATVNLTLSDDKNKQHLIYLTSVNTTQKINYVSARKDNVPLPTYSLNSKLNYWYSFLEKHKILYFNFSAVQEMETKSFKSFVDEMFKAIDAKPIEKLVIDLRYNNGGDNSILQPLIHSIIRNEKINQKGNLFTIIGRKTFSAAVSLVTELEEHTQTIFVGEPTLAPPNHYGETEVIRLPSSEVMLLYSSQFWQGSLPWDDRQWIEPSIRIELSSEDYKNGIDPVLNEIINYK